MSHHICCNECYDPTGTASVVLSSPYSSGGNVLEYHDIIQGNQNLTPVIWKTYTVSPTNDTQSVTFSNETFPLVSPVPGKSLKSMDILMWGGGGAGGIGARGGVSAGGSSAAIIIRNWQVSPSVTTYNVTVGGGGVPNFQGTTNIPAGNTIFSYNGAVVTAYAGGNGSGFSGDSYGGGGGGGAGTIGEPGAPDQAGAGGIGSFAGPIVQPFGIGGNGGSPSNINGSSGVTLTGVSADVANPFSYTLITGSGGGANIGLTFGGVGATSANGNVGGKLLYDASDVRIGATGAGGYNGNGGSSIPNTAAAENPIPGSGAGGGSPNFSSNQIDNPSILRSGANGASGKLMVILYY